MSPETLTRSNPPTLPAAIRSLVLLVALALVAGTPTARADSGDVDPAEVPIAVDAPDTCAGPTACVVDLDVPVPADVVLPAGADFAGAPAGNEGDGPPAPANRVRVILPPGYDAGSGPRPVVLLLHGAGDAHEVWVANTDVERFVAVAPWQGAAPIVVMPSGGGKRGDSGWYSDWVDPDESWDWESFHIEVVVPWIDATFATFGDADHRAIVGLSMGGFGAVSYAGRHPDLFTAVGSYSGFLDTQFGEPVSGHVLRLLEPYAGTPDERVWGDQLLDRDRWTFHNPAAMARAGRLESFDGRIWIRTGAGRSISPVPAAPLGVPGSDSDAIEAFIHVLNRSFLDAAAAGGLDDVDYAEYPDAGHEWPTWQRALHETLVDIVATID